VELVARQIVERVGAAQREVENSGMNTDRHASSLRLVHLTQRMVLFGIRLASTLPEETARAILAPGLVRFPQLWGLEVGGQRVKHATQAYRQAFPASSEKRFAEEWMRARGEAMAAVLPFLARWARGRPSSRITPAADLQLPEKGPVLIAALHYSIDPAVQLSCMAAATRDDFIWPVYPFHAGVEDDRELWLGGTTAPHSVTHMLRSITSPDWILDAAGHLRCGGAVFLAMDAPFDRNRRARHSIQIGEANMPLAPSIELLAALGGVRLFFASPRRQGPHSWTVDLQPADDVEELAQAAAAWISDHSLEWAGWPHILWREQAVSMRRARRA